MSDDWKFLPNENNTVQNDEYIICELPSVGDGSHPETEKNGELIARAPRLHAELESLLQQVGHLEKDADYDFSSARKLLAEMNPPSTARPIPPGLPALSDLVVDSNMSQVDFDGEYVDYIFWIDNVKGRDWKFTIAYEVEHGQWLDILFEDSAPQQSFEESEASEIPAIIAETAARLLKRCKEFKK